MNRKIIFSVMLALLLIAGCEEKTEKKINNICRENYQLAYPKIIAQNSIQAKKEIEKLIDECKGNAVMLDSLDALLEKIGYKIEKPTQVIIDSSIIFRSKKNILDSIKMRRKAIKEIETGTIESDVFLKMGKPHYMISAKQLSKRLDMKVDFDRYYWINPGCAPIVIDIEYQFGTVTGKDEGNSKSVCNSEWKQIRPPKRYKCKINMSNCTASK